MARFVLSQYKSSACCHEWASLSLHGRRMLKRQSAFSIQNLNAFPPSRCTQASGQSHIASISSSQYEKLPSCLVKTRRHGVREVSTRAATGANQLPGQLEQNSILLIREARLEEFWEVADTHCEAFCPELVFPTDWSIRWDRVLAMVAYVPVQLWVKRKCLVAVDVPWLGGSNEGRTDIILNSTNGSSLLQSEGSSKDSSSSEAPSSDDGLGPCRVAATVTVDAQAEFLLRRRPWGFRRKGIAYVSNMAVRDSWRRRGIARKLLRKAEETAMEWGCRSIALHCDKGCYAALNLYLTEGYKVINPPKGARWPQPRPAPGITLQLMLKILPPSK